jgi:flavin reductase (DIM6/NTAB) family NADH-FMN oxidoreductase RutF
MASGAFADVLRRFPMSVSVMTVGRGGAENGLTVSWVVPAAFDPPRLLVALHRLHYSLDFLRSTRNFAVNVLGAGSERIAGHFARQAMSDEQKVAKVETHEATTGAAILDDAIAWFDCEVVSLLECGDHVLVLGDVVDAGVQGPAETKPMVTTETGLRYTKVGPR